MWITAIILILIFNDMKKAIIVFTIAATVQCFSLFLDYKIRQERLEATDKITELIQHNYNSQQNINTTK